MRSWHDFVKVLKRSSKIFEKWTERRIVFIWSQENILFDFQEVLPAAYPPTVVQIINVDRSYPRFLSMIETLRL